MGYYDPPEPEFAGTDTFTCSMEVERKMVTPELARLIGELSVMPPDPWADTRPEAEVKEMRRRSVERKIGEVQRALSFIEETTRTCGWEGEADYCVVSNVIYWDCPACGTEHADEHASDRWGPDPDDRGDD